MLRLSLIRSIARGEYRRLAVCPQGEAISPVMRPPANNGAYDTRPDSLMSHQGLVSDGRRAFFFGSCRSKRPTPRRFGLVAETA